MTELTAMRMIEFDKEVTEEEVLEKLKETLSNEFCHIKIRKPKKSQYPILTCKVTTQWLHSIVCLRGIVKTQINGNKVKIIIDANTYAGKWFWFELIVVTPFTYGLALLVIIYQWSSQKKHTIAALNRMLDRLEFENKVL